MQFEFAAHLLSKHFSLLQTLIALILFNELWRTVLSVLWNISPVIQADFFLLRVETKDLGTLD